MFISNSRCGFSQKDNIAKNCDVLYYEKKTLDKLKEIVNKVNAGGTIIKSIGGSKKVFRIKCGNTNLSQEANEENIRNIILKVSTIIMAISQKHNSIKGVVIKTLNTIPFTLFGEIPLEDFNLIKSY